MKLYVALLLISISFCSFAQDESVVEKLVEKTFVPEVHKIQKEMDMTVQHHRVVLGSFKQKGPTFAFVEYGLGVKGERGITMKRAKMYRVETDGETITFIGDFKPDFCFYTYKVKKGIVEIDEVPACMLNRNTTAIKRKYRLSGNQLTEIK